MKLTKWKNLRNAFVAIVFALAFAGCSDVDSEPTSGNATQGTDSAGSDSGSGSGTETKGKIILHAQYPYIYIWESGMSRLDNKQSEMDTEGNGWYRFEIESSSAMVIFKPNADDWNGQTDDLHATTGEWWYNGSELSESKPSGGQGFVTTPSAPQNVTTKSTSSSSIKVSWSTVDGADSYVVYYRLSLGVGNDNYQRNGTETVKTTAGTSVSIQGLEEYKMYLFWVTAKNSAGESRESDVKIDYPSSTIGSGGSSSGTTTTTLSAPTGLTATTKSSSEITLIWNAVSGATEYHVYCSEYSYSSSASLLGTATSTSTTATGLKANTKYYFWVKATNGTTTSDYSLYDYATTKAATATWTPPTIYQELTNLGAENGIKGNVSAGNVYWFRLYAPQPSSSQYTYTISFFDRDTDASLFSSDVVATYYNQTGTIYASNVDNGTFGRSCSYILSQYLYVKVECKQSGSFAIYAERQRK